MLDVLISGGDLVDGTGSPRQHVDVGIRDGRVVQIGHNLGRADKVVDASGLIVAPGFVDIHTHYDAQAFWDPVLSPSALCGVTTVVAGNCGFSIQPLTESEGPYLMRMLAKVEGMPLEALEAGVPWDWASTSEYFSRLEGNLGVNAGFMIGHSPIRRAVMGEDANLRASTPEELSAMLELLRSGLRAGGMGFSSSLGTAHQDMEGNPVPSRFADESEIIALAAVCREFEGTSLEFLPKTNPTMPWTDDDVSLMIEMSRQAQRPLNWNVMLVSESNMERVEERLERGRQALDSGARIVMLVIPERGKAPGLTFRSGFMLDSLDGWGKVMSLPLAERLAVLKDPIQRRQLGELAAAHVARRALTNWGTYEISETFTPETKRYEGRLVADIAAEAGKEPFDALVDIAVADDLQTRFSPPFAEMSPRDWELNAQVISDSRALVGASDAGAHMDVLSLQGMYANVVANYARRHQLMSLEDAVHLITQAPANFYGLRDRGTLREGFAADVVVFDENTMETTRMEERADLPAGASRLVREVQGIQYVLVNGETVAIDGAYTGSLPGHLLRSGRDTQNPPMKP